MGNDTNSKKNCSYRLSTAGNIPATRTSGASALLENGMVFVAGSFIQNNNDRESKKTFFYNPNTEKFLQGPDINSQIDTIKLYVLSDNNVLLISNNKIEVFNVKTGETSEVLNKTNTEINYNECQIIPIGGEKHFLIVYPEEAFADFNNKLSYYYIFDEKLSTIETHKIDKESRIADSEIFPYNDDSIIAAYGNKVTIIDINTGKVKKETKTSFEYEMPAIIQLKDKRILYVPRQNILENVEIYNPETNTIKLIKIANSNINTLKLFNLVLLENENVMFQSDNPVIFDIKTEKIIDLNIKMPANFIDKWIPLQNGSVLCLYGYKLKEVGSGEDFDIKKIYVKDAYKLKPVE